METNQNRFVYLDNIRNFLVYNVVLFHVLLMFAYPLLFWWTVIDKKRSSGFFETSIVSMDIYMMPCLLFVAALFIFPSLNKMTALEYIKKRFLRLCVPAIIFLFCAGDISSHLILKRLNSVNPNYLETFRNFWQAFVNLPGIYITSSEKTLNAVMFNFHHTWFLTLLFFITLVVIILSLPFKRKNSGQTIVDSKKKIIFKIMIFAVAFSIVNTAALLYYVRHGIIGGSWLIAGKAVQFQIDHIWTLLTMFLFGLYMYKKEWLTRGDIGSWKMWGVIVFIFIVLYILIFHISVLPMFEEFCKVAEHNLLFANQMAMPVVDRSFQLEVLCSWLLLPLVCVFILMFFLSFAKKYFNKPNAITAFCSKHSINVYILHYIPVLILQYTFLNITIPPIVEIILMTIIIIPACLWLSHRLIYPYPKTAIAFFVVLKLVSLAAGFTFYYWALLALIFISFSGAVYESVSFMVTRKASLEPA